MIKLHHTFLPNTHLNHNMLKKKRRGGREKEKRKQNMILEITDTSKCGAYRNLFVSLITFLPG